MEKYTLSLVRDEMRFKLSKQSSIYFVYSIEEAARNNKEMH